MPKSDRSARPGTRHPGHRAERLAPGLARVAPLAVAGPFSEHGRGPRSERPVAYPFSDGRAPGSSPVFATTYEDVGTRRVILGGNVFRCVWGKARGMELLAPGYACAEPCGSPRNRVPEWFALFRPSLHPQRFSTLPTLSTVGLFKLRHSGRYEAASRGAFHSRLPGGSSLGASPHR